MRWAMSQSNRKRGGEHRRHASATAVKVLRFKQAITAVVIAALAVIMTIAARKLEPLLLLMPALYFLWMAWAVENDWEKGRIEQHVVACTQVQFLADSRVWFAEMRIRYIFTLCPERKGFH